MNFKMLTKLDNYLYRYASYQAFVVEEVCSMGYLHLNANHSEEFIKERLAKIKHYAAKVNLKLISLYKETETKYNERKSEKEYIDPYKEITSEILEIVNVQ